MKRTTRTEIRVETYELLAVKKRVGLAQGWCEHCGKRVGTISLEDTTRAGLSEDAIHQQAGRLHLIETADGLSFVCLDSLLRAVSID